MSSDQIPLNTPAIRKKFNKDGTEFRVKNNPSAISSRRNYLKNSVAPRRRKVLFDTAHVGRVPSERVMKDLDIPLQDLVASMRWYKSSHELSVKQEGKYRRLVERLI